MDGDGALEAVTVGSNGVLTPSGAPVGGVFEGGASGGVGDPFFFAASGTSPVGENACTLSNTAATTACGEEDTKQ